jgi:hypothetical protein
MRPEGRLLGQSLGVKNNPRNLFRTWHSNVQYEYAKIKPRRWQSIRLVIAFHQYGSFVFILHLSTNAQRTPCAAQPIERFLS